PMALGVATASLTAQAIGAGQPVAAQRTGMAAMALAVLGAPLTAAGLLAGRELILSAYTDDAKVAAVAGSLLVMIPLFHLCDSMQCINSYVLRAYKVAVVPLLLQIVALAGVGLLGGWWLGFGPGRGGLDWLRRIVIPDSPLGAGTMWLMAMIGLGLSTILLHASYWKIVRGYRLCDWTRAVRHDPASAASNLHSGVEEKISANPAPPALASRSHDTVRYPRSAPTP